MNSNKDFYQIHQARKHDLSLLLQRSLTVFQHLELSGRVESIRKLIERVSSDTFKVLVIGEFKRGKSTFINALLGEEVLPAFATPCTAVINEIKWGEQKKARLHFKNPLPTSLPSMLPLEVKEHLKNNATSSEIPAFDISVENLEEYVVIPDPAKDQAESVAESPYEKVEIFWPLTLCKNGVEIIDSPGLNEHGTRTKVTTGYLSNVDAVIFVMSCQALASQSELNVVDYQIRQNGHEDIFFIANRFDEIRERERERLISYGQQKLGVRTSRGIHWVFFLSALDALEGRQQNDSKMIERSGILRLESELARFLTSDRGRIKLVQPTRELIVGIRDARDQRIPKQRSMLQSSLAELEQKYERNKPALEDAEMRQQQITKRIQLHRKRLQQDIKSLAEPMLREMANELPRWVEDPDFKPQNTFKLLNITSSTKQIEALIKEVVAYLITRLERAQGEWQQQTLQPLVEARLQEMAEDVENTIQDFLHRLDLIGADIAGLSPESLNKDGDVSALERVLAAFGGFLIGGVGSAFVGGTLGLKEMAKSILPQLALIIGLIILNVTNPWLIMGTLFAGGFVQGLLKAASITEQIKKKVAEEMMRSLKEQARRLAEDIANKVFEETQSIESSIHSGMEIEIQSLREQVETILQDKRAGEDHVTAKKAVLDAQEKELQEIDKELTNLILTLASSR